MQKDFFEVIVTNGNTHLGGQDFDNILIKYCVEQFKNQTGIDISDDPKAMQRMRKECEQAKRNLSTSIEAHIYINSLSGNEDC